MTSTNYRMWMTIDDPKRCPDCKDLHGKIYRRNEPITPERPLHSFCRCFIVWLKAILAGMATEQGRNGADWWLKNLGKLPPYYISFAQAVRQGWDPNKVYLSKIAPGKMLARGIYENRNGHLPSAPGRIWYEADIDYEYGRRNSRRIVYSNDGLIFATYNHYKTFIEII